HLHRQPSSRLFPYTTLFRSGGLVGVIAIVVVAIVVLLQRRRGPEAPAVSLTPESWAVASEAVGPSEVRGEEPGSEREALPFECPDRKSTRLNSSHQINSYAV